jgi:hypothetical protein
VRTSDQGFSEGISKSDALRGSYWQYLSYTQVYFGYPPNTVPEQQYKFFPSHLIIASNLSYSFIEWSTTGEGFQYSECDKNYQAMFFETHTLNDLMHISLVQPVRAFLDWEQVYMERCKRQEGP